MSDSESDGEAQFQQWLARKQGGEPARPRAYDHRAQEDATAAHRPEKKSPGSSCQEEGRTALDPAAVEHDGAAVRVGPGPAEAGEERVRGEEACGGCGDGVAWPEVKEDFPGNETLEAERGKTVACSATEVAGGDFAARSGAAEQREEVVLEVEILLETEHGHDEVPRVDAVVANVPAAERGDGVAPQAAVVVPPVDSPLEPLCGGVVPQGGVAGEVGLAAPSEEELLVPAIRITTEEREGGSSSPQATDAGGAARFSVRSRVRAFMEKASTHTFLPTEATENDGKASSCSVSTAAERSSAMPPIDVASSLDDLERRAYEAMRPWLEDEAEASEFSMWRSGGGWAEELDEYSPHLPPLPPTPSAAEQSRLSNELNRSVDTLRSRLAAIQARLDMADVPVQLLPAPQAEDDEGAHVEEDKAALVEEDRQEARDLPVAVETMDGVDAVAPAMEQADGSVAVASLSGEAAEVVADRCSCRGCTGGFWACSRRLHVAEAGGGRPDDGSGGGDGVRGGDERAEGERRDSRVVGGDLGGAAARGTGDGNGGRGERDERKLREEGKLRDESNAADVCHEEGVDCWGDRGSGRGQHDGEYGERGEGGSTECSEKQSQRASGVEGARQVSEEEAETLVSQMKLLRQRWEVERGVRSNHMPAAAGQQGGGGSTEQDDRVGGSDESDDRDAPRDGAPIGVLDLEGDSSAGGAVSLERGERRVYSSPLERQLELDAVDQHQEDAERGRTEDACGGAEVSSTLDGEMNAIIGKVQEPLHELQLEPMPRVEHELRVHDKKLAVATKGPHRPTDACPQYSAASCAMLSSDNVPTDDEDDDDTDPMIAMLKLRIRESKAKLAALKSL